MKRLKELEAENARLRRAVSDLTLDKMILPKLPGETSKPGASPSLCGSCGLRTRCVRTTGMPGAWPVSIQAAQDPETPDDEAALTADIIALATQYGRYGYRRIMAMLRRSGWVVNLKRVERIWRREGLKVPQKQPKRGRL